MTDQLERAFKEAAKLSPEQQDSLASFLLAELDSESRWSDAFAKDPKALERLAQTALREGQQGKTEELDPSSL